MQHLMLVLAILLLAGIAGKRYPIATDTNNSILMKMEKMEESKTNIAEVAEEGDDDFFIYGAPALYDSFL
jgi:hypothetical protein